MSAANAPAMGCPVCRTPLVMSERQGIEIDYCPACRGVWLDRGELDKIVERSAGEFERPAPRSEPRSEPRRYHDDDGRHPFHGKRHKSFFSELFD